MTNFFDKKLGFGFLRLPLTDSNDDTSVDIEETKRMVDLFLSRGFTYFDTAYNYHGHQSEEFLREALTSRYPRSAYKLTTKLPCPAVKRGKTPEEIFNHQLQKCGVDYFDIYLLHGLDGEDAVYAEEHGCFDFLKQVKADGRAKHIGFSFHDTADVLDGILMLHPEMEVVQIQLNYLDWDNEIIQSAACLEVCRKHQKPVIVMEPIKGGTLANLPEKAADLLKGEKAAHAALRFAASQEGVAAVLSGMSSLSQLEENTALFSPFTPLTQNERAALGEIAKIIRETVSIPCTACSYCTDDCPKQIPIPRYFALYNERERDDWQANTEDRYAELTKTFSKASECISCRACEGRCPQKLPISELMAKVSKVYDA